MQTPPLVSSVILTRVSVRSLYPHVVEHSPSTQAPHTQLTAKEDVRMYNTEYVLE